MKQVNNIIREDSFHFQPSRSQKNIQSNSNPGPEKNIQGRSNAPLYSIILSILYINKIRKNIKRRKYREKIIEEWYQTELSYCYDLQVTNNFIKKPMEETRIINRQQSLILFPQIQAMLQLSQKMIKALSNARNLVMPYKNRLGKDLIQFISEYRVYGSYFSTHSKRLQLVSEILSSSEHQINKFKTIQANMQAEFSKNNPKKEGMTIKDCMDQPLYRLFKYVILLKEYSNKMPKFHPDHDPIKKCQSIFHEINNNNNNMMKRMEQKQKTKKLARLFGENVREDHQFIAEMEARTVYFKVKLYVFTDCVAVTKVQEFFGAEREERFAVFQINQFSYVSSPPNLKYFKNIIILISKQHCVHLFFPQYQSKTQFLSCLNKQIHQIRIHNHNHRKIPKKYVLLQKRTSERSSSSSQKQIKYLSVQPELRVEVIGFQVRVAGSLSSNSVYLVRFMIPGYYEDQVNCLEDQESYIEKQCMKNFDISDRKSKNCRGLEILETTQTSRNSENSERASKKYKSYSIHQKIEMNYSVLQQLYDHMQALCPDRIPQLDPTTKDVNFYSKGTKKTKFYQVRKFLIEQFFNFSLRHLSILSHPSWFLSKIRINEDLWNYVVKRNGSMKENQNSMRLYGFDHCNTCQNARIRSIEQFQYLREHYNSGKCYRDNIQQSKYCFNFFNLLKLRFQYLNVLDFNTTQRILTYFHYMEGRLDYPFLIHRNKQKNIKLVKIYLPSIDQKFIEVQVDPKTTVGQIIDQLGNILRIYNCFDFDLMVNYSETNRILDRDQFMLDVIKALDIESQDVCVTNNVVKKKFTFNFFSTLKQLVLQSAPNENKIYFLKTVYFNKSLQIKSFIAYPQKMFLEIQKIYWTIRKGKVKLTRPQFIQRVAHLCCLKQFQGIKNYEMVKSSSRYIEKVMPDQHGHIFHYQHQFKKEIIEAIDRERVFLLTNNKSLQHLQFKILQLSYEKIGHRTYYIQAQSKQIPSYFSQKIQIPDTVLLGVNYKNLVIARNQTNATVLFTLPIGEIQYYLSVYSIFITYQTWNFRFDAKMLHHFGEIIRKYQSVLSKFPQYMA